MGQGNLYNIDYVSSQRISGGTVTTNSLTFSGDLTVDSLSGATVSGGTFKHHHLPMDYVIWKDDSTYYNKKTSDGTIYYDTDASTVIQNALDGLHHNAGTVFIKSGNYEILTPIEMKTMTWIIGDGMRNTILDNNSSGCCIAISSAIAWSDEGGGIANLQILGDGYGGKAGYGISGNSPDHFNIRDIKFLDYPGHSIHLVRMYYTKIKNCTFYNCSGVMIYAGEDGKRTTTSLIEGNGIEACWGSGMVIDAADDMWLVNNYFETPQNQSVCGIAVINNSNRTKIIGNSFINSTGGGGTYPRDNIKLNSISTNYVSDPHIEGNDFICTDAWGSGDGKAINMDGKIYRVFITNNKFRSFTGVAISINADYLNISDNQFVTCKSGCMSGSPYYFNIHNNVINAGTGPDEVISFSYPYYGTIHDNFIWGGNNKGIYLATPREVTVANNTINKTDGDKIHLNAGRRCNVIGNTLWSGNNSGDGIYLQNMEATNVQNNLITVAHDYGIQIDSNCSRCYITDNYVSGTSSDAISTVDNNIYQNNVIVNDLINVTKVNSISSQAISGGTITTNSLTFSGDLTVDSLSGATVSGGTFTSIYHPATYIIYSSNGLYHARNGVNNTLDNSNSNASKVIQYAVDNASDGGLISVVDDVPIEATVTGATNVILDFNNHWVYPDAGVDAFLMPPHFYMKNAYIDATNAASGQRYITYDGSYITWGSAAGGGVSNIYISANGGLATPRHSGTGILFKTDRALTDSTAPGVLFTTNENIHCINLKEGILMRHYGSGGGFLTANHFNNIYMRNCDHMISIPDKVEYGSSGAVGGNLFNNLSLQGDDSYPNNVTYGILVGKGSNRFHNVRWWDFGSVQTTMYVMSGANDTVIIGNVSPGLAYSSQGAAGDESMFIDENSSTIRLKHLKGIPDPRGGTWGRVHINENGTDGTEINEDGEGHLYIFRLTDSGEEPKVLIYGYDSLAGSTGYMRHYVDNDGYGVIDTNNTITDGIRIDDLVQINQSCTDNIYVFSGGEGTSFIRVDGHISSQTGIYAHFVSANNSNIAGGAGIENVVEDLTPQLGGDLDANSKTIYNATGVSSAAISGGAIVGDLWHTADYIINRVDDTYYCKDGLKGTIVSSTTDRCEGIFNYAIEQLSNGGKVFVRNGEYVLSSSINLADNIWIQGAGMDNTWLYTNSGGIYSINKENLRLSDFTMSGAFNIDIKFGTGASKYHLKDYHFENLKVIMVSTQVTKNLGATQMQGLCFYNGSRLLEHIRILNCKFHKTISHGVCFYGDSGSTGDGIYRDILKDVVIDNCTAIRCGGHAIRGSNWGTGFCLTHHPKIQGMEVSNCFVSGSWETGYYMEGHSENYGVNLTNCIAEYCGVEKMEMWGEYGEETDPLIPNSGALQGWGFGGHGDIKYNSCSAIGNNFGGILIAGININKINKRNHRGIAVNCFVDGKGITGQYGIKANSNAISGALIANNTIYGVTGQAIDITGRYPVIRDNYIRIKNSKSTTTAPGIDIRNTIRPIVDGNYIEGSGQFATTNRSIIGDNTDNAIITNNTVLNAGWAGIEGGSFCTIKDNYVSGAVQGIITQGADYITLDGNRVVGCSSRGITCKMGLYGVVSNNQVENCSDDGILITYTTERSGCSIVGNYVYNCAGTGIELHRNLVDNLIEANKIINCTGIGIYSHGSGNTIVGNFVKNCGTSGIDLLGRRHFVANNTCINNTSYGIHSEGKDCKIFNNNCYNDNASLLQDYGIREASTVSNNYYRNNYLSGTNANAMTVQSAGEAKLLQNIGYVTENTGWTSIADGGTVAHGCAMKPTNVSLVPSGANPISYAFTVDSTNITIYHSNEGNADFSWRAEV